MIKQNNIKIKPSKIYPLMINSNTLPLYIIKRKVARKYFCRYEFPLLELKNEDAADHDADANDFIEA